MMDDIITYTNCSSFSRRWEQNSFSIINLCQLNRYSTAWKNKDTNDGEKEGDDDLLTYWLWSCSYSHDENFVPQYLRYNELWNVLRSSYYPFLVALSLLIPERNFLI